MSVRPSHRALLIGLWLAVTLKADIQPAERVEPDLSAEWQREYQTLAMDLTNRARFERVASQSFHPAALLEPADRDPADIVLRRTAVLLADLSQTGEAGNLEPLAASLRTLQREAGATPLAEVAARRGLFEAACRLRREVAFRNPLLDFRQLLFIQRHRALMDHMCDQYYGIAARPRGGVFVLEDPWGPEPRRRDLLADSVCENGRLAGQRLSGGPRRAWDLRYDGMGRLEGEETSGGAFLSPALSYDGQTILFAYVECQGDRQHRAHTDPTRGHWAEGRSYHLFRVDRDGSRLRQLTDGTWNDFAPCWLPNGRIAFISERRGGYLRCGRVCPIYTVFDLADDGSDIRCLSFHETNEWHPEVTQDGRLVYTRWDYVDRHGVVAHTPWTMSPDGRDPRALHGNYAVRSARADMELDVRAIPGSRRLVATGAPHHGQAFGSLVVIDPAIPDDDAMGRFGGSPRTWTFPRRREASRPTARPGHSVSTTISVSMIRRPGWKAPDRGAPTGSTSWTASGLQIPQGNDSVNIARAVLGEVPVEADGSAHFVVPARKELYFQVLDEAGLAITSMRSGTQFQPGERATCVGCHEPAHATPVAARTRPLALRRAPSRLEPGPDGSNPFSYPRLVQPVLDRHCVECHAQAAEVAPPLDARLVQHPGRGGMNVATTYYASYLSLAPGFGFYNYGGRDWNDPKWHRTTPGEFGARASRLQTLLAQGHYGVRLPPEDWRRLALWLDSCSAFYGVYEPPGGEAQLRGEVVRPTLE